jgi:hypothetical protein
VDALERNRKVNEVRIRGMEGAIGEGRSEPIGPTLPVAVPPPDVAVTPSDEPTPADAKPAPAGRIFVADLPAGEDARGLGSALRPLAELAVRRDTETPLAIGILGEAGTGKTFALTALLTQIAALARDPADPRSFLQRMATATIDVTRLEGEAPVALAGAIYEFLAATYPGLAVGAADAVQDPRLAAREAAERLDAARLRLDGERQSLTEIESRRARIIEAVLFETAGSRIDAYARANRTRIENRLESFGFAGEPILYFKSLVRDLAETGGPLARLGAAVRTLWAYKGQARLLVASVALWLVGLGLGAVVASQATWLAWLQNVNESLVPAATWIGAHIDWLSTAQRAAYAIAALALLLNVLRALRFLQPLFRGVTLLNFDVAAKKRDLDTLYAHQMRRVDALMAEVERIARQAAEADRRADTHRGGDLVVDPSPFETDSARTRAERFFASLGRLLQNAERGEQIGTDAKKPGPERIVIALDNLDAVPVDVATRVLEAAHRLLAQAGLVLVLALDPRRLFTLHPEMAQRLEKWIQIPFRVSPEATPSEPRGLVAQIIGRAGRKSEAQDSAIDWTLSDSEAAALMALAPIAGSAPRNVKRFVNIYRIVRTQAPDSKAELALMLALDLGGSEEERAAVTAELSATNTNADLDIAALGPRIGGALREAKVRKVKVAAARRAAAVVRSYSLNGWSGVGPAQ